jgi:hypothetical protein
MRSKHYKKLFPDRTLRLNSSNLSATLMWITIEREINTSRIEYVFEG